MPACRLRRFFAANSNSETDKMASFCKDNTPEEPVVGSPDLDADMFYALTQEEYEQAVQQANKASR